MKKPPTGNIPRQPDTRLRWDEDGPQDRIWPIAVTAPVDQALRDQNQEPRRRYHFLG